MHTLNCYLIADQDDTPVLVGGTPGGDYQPQWNIQTITGLIDGGLDVQQASEQPRWQIRPATYPAERGNAFSLTVEDRLGEEICRAGGDGLPNRARRRWGAGGSVQVIARDPETGILAGGSDPRAEGWLSVCGSLRSVAGSQSGEGPVDMMGLCEYHAGVSTLCL